MIIAVVVIITIILLILIVIIIIIMMIIMAQGSGLDVLGPERAPQECTGKGLRRQGAVET